MKSTERTQSEPNLDAHLVSSVEEASARWLAARENAITVSSVECRVTRTSTPTTRISSLSGKHGRSGTRKVWPRPEPSSGIGSASSGRRKSSRKIRDSALQFE